MLPLLELVGLRIEIKSLKKTIKKELLAHFDSSKTTTLRFSRQDLDKRNHIVFHTQDNEIEISGEMYDIISLTLSSDSLIYTCYKDHKESELKRKMYASLANLFSQNPDKSDTTKSLFLFLKNLIFEAIEPISYFKFTFNETISHNKYIAVICSGHYLLDSPPPEL
ncbi:MAG: hypothetical protein ACK4VL_13890 [Chitinophagales bacterium]|jgi:hypothetical protein